MSRYTRMPSRYRRLERIRHAATIAGYLIVLALAALMWALELTS